LRSYTRRQRPFVPSWQKGRRPLPIPADVACALWPPPANPLIRQRGSGITT
tara:strand:+ start:109643 stop:109795 length:153 start_codon:yes stop_codon:yes gene_type:complete